MTRLKTYACEFSIQYDNGEKTDYTGYIEAFNKDDARDKLQLTWLGYEPIINSIKLFKKSGKR